MNIDSIFPHIVEHKLNIHKKYALACSGGMDSMVLFHLLVRQGYQFVVLHCNFMLRGDDSITDEQFVKSVCERHQIPFYSVQFDTKNSASKNKNSIEVEARNLRYAYFEKMKQVLNYDILLTAHHADDAIETQLFKIIKGTGWKGLQGIPQENGYIFRPLLQISKKEIEQYTKDFQIEFRQDLSNFESIYTRNKIRNQILPQFEAINPNYRNAFGKLSQFAIQVEDFVSEILDEEIQNWDKYKKVNLKKWTNKSYISLILYRLLEEFGPNTTQIADIAQCLFSTENKEILIGNSLFYIKNGWIELAKNEIIHFEHRIDEWKDQNFIDYNLSKKTVSSFEQGKIYLDDAQITLPIIARNINKDDFMAPMGMNGKIKRVLDILKDKKLSENEKNNTFVLEDGDKKIIAILGIAQSESTKITEKNKPLWVFSKNT
jgi:tRNA(Ile)-lysidine synthase